MLLFITNDVLSDSGAPWKKTAESKNDKNENFYHGPAGPSDIEITSYCVLAYLKIGQPSDAQNLVKWLQKQQNTFGGYCSTQVSFMHFC